MITHQEVKIPKLMGIINLTPDSFYPQSRTSLDILTKKIKAFVEGGVDILDLGAESTRPYAKPVDADIELENLLPAIKIIRDITDLPISIDSYKPQVFLEVLKTKKIQYLNDISAFEKFEVADKKLQTEILKEVKQQNIKIILMHKKGEPITMQDKPVYEDLIIEIINYLQARINYLESLGIIKQNLIIDPGFGFGKTFEHNKTLMQNLDKVRDTIKLPILVGISNKKTIGILLGRVDVPFEVHQREFGTIGANLLAYTKGADIIRTHNPQASFEALKVFIKFSQ